MWYHNCMWYIWRHNKSTHLTLWKKVRIQSYPPCQSVNHQDWLFFRAAWYSQGSLRDFLRNFPTNTEAVITVQESVPIKVYVMCFSSRWIHFVSRNRLWYVNDCQKHRLEVHCYDTKTAGTKQDSTVLCLYQVRLHWILPLFGQMWKQYSSEQMMIYIFNKSWLFFSIFLYLQSLQLSVDLHICWHFTK